MGKTKIEWTDKSWTPSISRTSGIGTLAIAWPIESASQSVERCEREIERAKAWIAANGPDKGALLGLDDWFFELLILRGEIELPRIFGEKA